jgi:hypothetical protein
MNKISGRFSSLILAGSILLFSGILNAQNGYRTPEQIDSWCKAFAQANQMNVNHAILAESPGGRSVNLLEIGTSIGKTDNSKPAVLVVANMNGLSILTSKATRKES